MSQPLAAVALAGMLLVGAGAWGAGCDKTCLEAIGDAYRSAYLAHDRKAAPIAARVRFTENNVEMKFPDASWDTVTREIGPALTLSDTRTGSVGIYTTVMQNDTAGHLAVRLRVRRGQITEIEHLVATRRNLSAPPTPFAEPAAFVRDPDLARIVPAEQRISRARLIAHANGYFTTLQHNDGAIRGTRFAPAATRFENGLAFADIEKGFRAGRYRFNDRVRDRDFFLVDEERQIVMARAYVDHKGMLDEYPLTDGTQVRSMFREPHTWSMLASFKIRDDNIVAVETTFIGAPYNVRSPWTKRRGASDDAP